MNETELNKRLEIFQKKVEVAQAESDVPSMVLYVLLEHGGYEEPASVVGGESWNLPNKMDERTVEYSALVNITLLGYLWARLEVLKQESAAEFGPDFSVKLQREVQGYMRQSSAMEQPGFQTSLTDLVRSYEPSIAVGCTVGSETTPCEPAAYMATSTRPAGDLILSFAAIKRGYEALIEHTAKNIGIAQSKFEAMIDEVGN